ncbi:uncharacterized protein LOC124363822 [Homalodisca vitripennis]|uniref:uncharacterized protein LOC124363822 n=1 Tax=Homalodisca vitripennis TaxID=197043 RepID=UPI001EEA3512|nr:uncharacterized protein LOC124363822 [Homalodisca vitripennis]
MLPLLPLLLVTTGSISVAQDVKDGYNIYKDMQRGKVEELERLVSDVDFQIDHAEHTWPSVGGKFHMLNSAKRTINQFKNQMLSKDNDDGEDIEQGDESESDMSDEVLDEDDVTTGRILIPRTHVMWKGEDAKLKRGAILWGLRLAASQSDNNRLFRDLIFLSKTGKYMPLSFYKGIKEELLATSKTVCEQLHRDHPQCN